MERKEFLRAFVIGIDLDAAAKRGQLHMQNMVSASFLTTGWTADVTLKTPCPREWTVRFRRGALAWKANCLKSGRCSHECSQ